MTYDTEIHVLRQAAEAEAARFVLDPGELKGRDHITGYAIDAFTAGEDAISPRKEDGKEILQVSTADPGSFIKPEDAIALYALWQVESRYRGRRATTPMFPKQIEKVFSFRNGLPRPALTFRIPVDREGNRSRPQITRNIITATSITPTEVEQRISQEDDQGDFSTLWRMARRLYIARHAGKVRLPSHLEDDQGRIVSKGGKGAVAQFIVQEAMFAINAEAGLLINGSDTLSGIFLNHAIPEGQHEDTPPERRAAQARLSYSTTAHGHLQLGVPAYAPVSSPLRKSVAFINQSNLAFEAAKRAGKGPPYTGDILAYAVQRANTVEVRPTIPGEQRKVVRAITLRAEQLHQKLTESHVEPGDLAHLILGTLSGTAEEIHAAREAAVNYVAQNTQLASAVLDIAFSKGWLRVEHRLVEGQEDQTTPVFVDIANNTYPYGLNGQQVHDAVTIASLFGTITGHNVQPQEPRLVVAGKIMNSPETFLSELCNQTGMYFGYTKQPDQDGKKVIVARLSIGDKIYTERFEGKSTRQALRNAANFFIDTRDLINNPPPLKQHRKKGDKPPGPKVSKRKPERSEETNT